MSESREGTYCAPTSTLPPDSRNYVTREADISLATLLNERQFVYLLAARKMGKSSLLVRIQKQLQEEKADFRIAYIDLSPLGTPRELLTDTGINKWYTRLLGEIIRKTQLDLDLRVILGTIPNHYNPHQNFREAFLSIVKSTDKTIVVMLDEINALNTVAWSADFLCILRSLDNVKSENDQSLRILRTRFCFCVTGCVSLESLLGDRGTAASNNAVHLPLSFFRSDHLSSVLRGNTKLSALRWRYDWTFEILCKKVYEFTSGHPFLTHLLCHKIVESLAKQHTPAVASTITSEIERCIQGNDNHFFRDCATYLLSYSGKGGKARLRYLLMRLHNFGHIALAEEDEAIQHLCFSGIIRRSDDDTQYIFSNELFRARFSEKFISSSLDDPNRALKKLLFAYVTSILLIVTCIVYFFPFFELLVLRGNRDDLPAARNTASMARLFPWAPEDSIEQCLAEISEAYRRKQFENLFAALLEADYESATKVLTDLKENGVVYEQRYDESSSVNLPLDTADEHLTPSTWSRSLYVYEPEPNLECIPSESKSLTAVMWDLIMQYRRNFRFKEETPRDDKRVWVAEAGRNLGSDPPFFHELISWAENSYRNGLLGEELLQAMKKNEIQNAINCYLTLLNDAKIISAFDGNGVEFDGLERFPPPFRGGFARKLIPTIASSFLFNENYNHVPFPDKKRYIDEQLLKRDAGDLRYLNIALGFVVEDQPILPFAASRIANQDNESVHKQLKDFLETLLNELREKNSLSGLRYLARITEEVPTLHMLTREALSKAVMDRAHRLVLLERVDLALAVIDTNIKWDFDGNLASEKLRLTFARYPEMLTQTNLRPSDNRFEISPDSPRFAAKLASQSLDHFIQTEQGLTIAMSYRAIVAMNANGTTRWTRHLDSQIVRCVDLPTQKILAVLTNASMLYVIAVDSGEILSTTELTKCTYDSRHAIVADGNTLFVIGTKDSPLSLAWPVIQNGPQESWLDEILKPLCISQILIESTQLTPAREAKNISIVAKEVSGFTLPNAASLKGATITPKQILIFSDRHVHAINRTDFKSVSAAIPLMEGVIESVVPFELDSIGLVSSGPTGFRVLRFQVNDDGRALHEIATLGPGKLLEPTCRGELVFLHADESAATVIRSISNIERIALPAWGGELERLDIVDNLVILSDESSYLTAFEMGSLKSVGRYFQPGLTATYISQQGLLFVLREEAVRVFPLDKVFRDRQYKVALSAIRKAEKADDAFVSLLMEATESARATKEIELASEAFQQNQGRTGRGHRVPIATAPLPRLPYRFEQIITAHAYLPEWTSFDLPKALSERRFSTALRKEERVSQHPQLHAKVLQPGDIDLVFIEDDSGMDVGCCVWMSQDSYKFSSFVTNRSRSLVYPICTYTVAFDVKLQSMCIDYLSETIWVTHTEGVSRLTEVNGRDTYSGEEFPIYETASTSFVSVEENIAVKYQGGLLLVRNNEVVVLPTSSPNSDSDGKTVDLWAPPERADMLSNERTNVADYLRGFATEQLQSAFPSGYVADEFGVCRDGDFVDLQSVPRYLRTREADVTIISMPGMPFLELVKSEYFGDGVIENRNHRVPRSTRLIYSENGETYFPMPGDRIWGVLNPFALMHLSRGEILLQAHQSDKSRETMLRSSMAGASGM